MQNFIESNLQAFLCIRFLASEYSTGKTHGGRINSSDLDENHSPVIIEYKRSVGENVVSQGFASTTPVSAVPPGARPGPCKHG